MVRKYFAGANTASGYVTKLSDNLLGIDKIYGISGRTKTHKTEILESILKTGEKKYQNIECIMNPFNITKIDAVIFRDIKTAVVDAEEYHGENLDIIGKTDNFEKEETDEIKELLKKAGIVKESFYDAYYSAKKIHDEWEKIYIKNMKFERFNAYQDGVIIKMFPKKNDNKGTYKHHRFFGASTPDGSVNYIDNLTENLKRRYFIKGRPGTGKSTFLKRVVKKADEMGYSTEIYYCSFDEASLDMVIVPELGFCVFDSTAPHEMFPESERDMILDFYSEAGLSGVDEKHSRELKEIGDRYKHKISEGMAYLRLYKLYMKESERLIILGDKGNEFNSFKEKIVNDILGT